MIAADRRRPRPVADHQRLPAGARRREAGARRRQPLQRLGRLAPARPLLRAHPPRRAGCGAARTRGRWPPSPRPHPIKVNAVAIRGFTEEEVIPFAELARETPYEVRFIEFMPLDADHAWNRSKVLTGAEIREAITAVYPLEPEPREPSSTSQVYRFADSPGRIGFINPVSEPFCADCNRVRLTADGRLRTCLFSLNETDLREPLRDGRVRRRARARSSATPCGARSSSTTWASRASSSPRAACPPSAADHPSPATLPDHPACPGRARGVKTPGCRLSLVEGLARSLACDSVKIARIADRQFGHVTRRQLLGLGVPSRDHRPLDQERPADPRPRRRLRRRPPPAHARSPRPWPPSWPAATEPSSATTPPRPSGASEPGPQRPRSPPPITAAAPASAPTAPRPSPAKTSAATATSASPAPPAPSSTSRAA